MHLRPQLELVAVDSGQVENAEVQKPKYGNESAETEVRKWEEKPPIGA